MSHEATGKSNEWYTPKYIFNALGCVFDMDVASPIDQRFISVPAVEYIHKNSLEVQWNGFVWMNPPYGNIKTKEAWLEKFFSHRNGIALMPDRTSCSWWHKYVTRADAVMFIKGKVKFIDQFGNVGNQPSNGTNLIAIGSKGVGALLNAQRKGLGQVFKPVKMEEA